MDITQQAVAKFEKSIDQPKMSTVRRLTDALDVTLSELVADWSTFRKDEILDDMDNYQDKYDDLKTR